MLADSLAPNVITAITTRDGGGVQVDPVGVVAAYDMVLSFSRLAFLRA